MKKSFLYFFLLMFLILPAAYANDSSPFDIPQHEIKQAPAAVLSLKLQHDESVVNLSVAPDRPEVVLIVNSNQQGQKLVFWDISVDKKDAVTRTVNIPNTITLSSVTWHPAGQTLFLIGSEGGKQKIYKTDAAKWTPTILYTSDSELNRLIVGPRPFLTSASSNGSGDKAATLGQDYRIFFGIKKADSKFATHTITENGKLEYAVLDSKQSSFGFSGEEEELPHVVITDSAIPEGFHPAGHLIVWQNEKHCFQRNAYEGDNWGKTVENAMGVNPICGGNVSYTPNGMAIIHWEDSKKGVKLIYDSGNKTENLADNIQFASAPVVTPDGKGLIGFTKDNGVSTLIYNPVTMPLADVVNAWMFIETPQDRTLLTSNSGLLRPSYGDQLYQLYDSESYSGNGHDYTPPRPYFITTDTFWELYGAAFEGIFILSERQSAIPGFWQFVEKAHADLIKNHADAKMTKIFAVLLDVHHGTVTPNSEASKIMASDGISTSFITKENFDYGNLKPRSHYVTDVELQNYFRASKYLMDTELKEEDVALLKQLPKKTMAEALKWVNAYKPFIAPSRNSVIWEKDKSKPSYITTSSKPLEQIFPLSWGIDNEILHNTVNDQIPDNRILPSGVDIAAVLGSDVANVILEESGEYKNYPSLKDKITSLKQRLGDSKTWVKPEDTLYQKWMAALATQWSNDVASPGNIIKKDFWQRKRLQTGLASWATLRHATVLVNERDAAEAGEAGFEPIVFLPPRGYVEPDPKTFQAIADMFDATIQSVQAQTNEWQGTTPDSENNTEGLQQGIIHRLTESRDNILKFRNIAAKELKNEPLTSQDYEDIFYVGRAGEHNFLIFKSLAEKDFALSIPDPITKVADVAGKAGNLLLSGVGNPIEWDQIVPFFGLKEIVKGPVYSYYEHVSPVVMTDKEWTDKVDKLPRPSWITPYFSDHKLESSAKAP